MKLIDGKKIALKIKDEIKDQVDKMIERGEKPPHLAAVIVGNDGASLTYVGSKVKSCKQVGFNSTLITLPDNISENELLYEVDKLNKNNDIDGFIVQLPLPKHIDENKVTLSINPNRMLMGFIPQILEKWP